MWYAVYYNNYIRLSIVGQLLTRVDYGPVTRKLNESCKVTDIYAWGQIPKNVSEDHKWVQKKREGKMSTSRKGE